MAVINTIDDLNTHPATAGENTGARVLRIVKIIDIAAADSDLSVFELAEVPDTAVIDDITLNTDDIAGGSDYNVGLYGVDGSTIDDNAFADALDLSGHATSSLGQHAGYDHKAMTAVTPANANKMVFELAGHVNKAFPATGETQRKSKYRIGLQAVTIGTGAGTIVATTTYRMPF